MQVLKKIALFFLVIALFGCNGRLTDNRISVSDKKYEIVDYDDYKLKHQSVKFLGVSYE